VATAVLAVGCSSSSSPAADSATTTSSLASTTASTPGGTGSTLSTFPPGTVAVDVGQSDLGPLLIDGTGYTLYTFGTDTSGTPTCLDATCVATWPPITGTGIAVATDAGFANGLFKLVARPDGTRQLAVGGRPVYRYSGDTKPGDTNGQGIGNQWFAVSPDGTPISG